VHIQSSFAGSKIIADQHVCVIDGSLLAGLRLFSVLKQNALSHSFMQ
jgi:hypothetical protein